ncbi:hypothetical protein FKW77_006601 [Venturia effusa]|uniref:FAS1 domain-containing protein n=1 Tax=Venturia effusa TaxID=50376 RepID=A0A517LQB7_9PEZI|nr:hypothetical protein FKW77_006601 [Venturia effusa]
MLAFNKTTSANQTSSGAILAVLQYHVLFGRYPIMSQVGVPLIGAGDEPQFLPTLLNDPTYANMSGGQRVEHLFTSQSVFRSGLHQDSAIISADIAYVEQNGLPGLLNVIDKVLSIPNTTVGSLKAGNFTTGYNLATKLPKETSHQNLPAKYHTLFIPNDRVPEVSQFTTDYLVATIDYHIFPDYLLYSPDFSDNFTMMSLHGENATMRIVNGDTYVNDAKVVATDWLVYNGVLHILDRTLNYSQPNNLPEPLLALTGNGTTTPSAKSSTRAKSDALPVGAKVGIGLVVAITALGIIGIAIFVHRRRTGRGRKESLNELSGQYKLEKVYEMASPDEAVAELNDKSQIVAELPGAVSNPAELDGGAETASLKELDTNERLDVVSSDARSRRKSMDIRMQRKNEQDRIRLDNARENTQTPLDKQERENRRNDADGGVYRPSDHPPQPMSTADAFGLSRITQANREIVPDTPIDETSLQRIMTPDPEESRVRPSVSMSEEPRSPISPMSSLREGDLASPSNQQGPDQIPTSATPTTSPVREVNWGREGLFSTPVNTGMPESATRNTGK